jgi:hypothetical protein
VTAICAGFDHEMPIVDSDRKPGMAIAIDATSVSSSGDCEQEAGWCASSQSAPRIMRQFGHGELFRLLREVESLEQTL